MGTLLSLVLGLHGVVHILGFLQWSGVFGALWLVALVALISAALLRLGRSTWWWAPGLAGLFLSQGLILSAWSYAKLGTIVNVILFLPALAAAAHARFERRSDREILALLERAPQAPPAVVLAADLVRLPPPVRRWLDAAGVIGRERSSIVHLEQRGQLRTRPDGTWLPARAEQYFTVDPPGFVWRVDATLM